LANPLRLKINPLKPIRLKKGLDCNFLGCQVSLVQVQVGGGGLIVGTTWLPLNGTLIRDP